MKIKYSFSQCCTIHAAAILNTGQPGMLDRGINQTDNGMTSSLANMHQDSADKNSAGKRIMVTPPRIAAGESAITSLINTCRVGKRWCTVRDGAFDAHEGFRDQELQCALKERLHRQNLCRCRAYSGKNS
uniref:Uncharacterized protein n=1 Tax=Cryptomonas curvata TaxID=233186 RepID=A0A6T8CCT5_9CRYP|mmetsp:Transcript_54069/g.113032  ORF Transcript_54069/g.113032 Transcript_54069/m.113032 type:complete len:130 (+) Transcript_54069:172-561(+)